VPAQASAERNVRRSPYSPANASAFGPSRLRVDDEITAGGALDSGRMPASTRSASGITRSSTMSARLPFAMIKRLREVEVADVGDRCRARSGGP
jgi:hypothetical protein